MQGRKKGSETRIEVQGIARQLSEFSVGLSSMQILLALHVHVQYLVL